MFGADVWGNDPTKILHAISMNDKEEPANDCRHVSVAHTSHNACCFIFPRQIEVEPAVPF